MKAGSLSWCNYTLGRTKSALLVMEIGSFQQNDGITLMEGCDLPLIVRASTSVPGQFEGNGEMSESVGGWILSKYQREKVTSA